MLKKFTVGLMGLALVFAVGCASKKKAVEPGSGDGLGGESATISQESFNFSAQGSDSSTIQGLSTINFAYDSAVLDTKARSVLAENAAWIKQNSKLTMQIEGHCDSRGSVEYNLALGERRAKVVKDYLTNLGVDSKRMTLISYGKEKLLEVGDSEEVHARNRRANFVPLAN